MVRAIVDGVETKSLSVQDRGLAYGDGLFETIGVRSGEPCLWEAHLRRLQLGASRLAIPCPERSLLEAECRRAIGNASSCVIKLVLTRGVGGRGYRPPPCPEPTRILTRHPWPDYPPEWTTGGVWVRICSTRLGQNPSLAGIKHLNRLEQVLARSEWEDPRVAEGIMCDLDGRLVAGTMSNLYLVQGRRISTPRLDRCGISGTVRGLVLEMAGSFGLIAVERELGTRDLNGADGLFLTNSLIGAWPVRRLEGRDFELGQLPLGLLDAVRALAHNPHPESPVRCGPC